MLSNSGLEKLQTCIYRIRRSLSGCGQAYNTAETADQHAYIYRSLRMQQLTRANYSSFMFSQHAVYLSILVYNEAITLSGLHNNSIEATELRSTF